MTHPEQLPLFDLPPVDTQSAPAAHPPQNIAESNPSVRPDCAGADTAPRKRAKQLSLDVKFYVVCSGGDEFIVQAKSPSAAKYLAFKRAKESGLYLYNGGFLAFVEGGLTVAELRK